MHPEEQAVENRNANRFEKLFEHLALDRIIARLQDLEIHSDGLTWTRFGGSLALVLVVLLFLSGAFMAFYYSPAPGAAYDSVDYALFSVPFGEMIRGIHHYAWNLLLILIGLHLTRAFILGAYKTPRQMIWISGVFIMIIIPAFIFTGDLLLWDQKGYWSTQVRNSIISSVPLVGDFAVRMIQGGPLIGIVTLTRYYVLHIIFLPSLLIFLIAVHFHFLRHRGVSGSLSGEEAVRQKVPFLPTMVNRWLILFIVVTVVMGLVTWHWPALLDNPADPTDSSYIPKPEWWVLFLNQLVGIFTGPLMVIATVIIPGGLLALIVALPFLDRSPERHPLHRKKIMLVAAIITIVLLGLSFMGYMEHFEISDS
jgi:ubiquinol-cytochrome c reductase cytochrome b subunit